MCYSAVICVNLLPCVLALPPSVLLCCDMCYSAAMCVVPSSKCVTLLSYVLLCCHVCHPTFMCLACVVGVPEGGVGVAPVSPGLKRKLRRRDMLGPGGDSQEPIPASFVHLTKPLLYSPSLQRSVTASSMSSRSTCSSVTDSDDSRLSQAVTSSQPTDVTDSELESASGSLRDDSGVTTDDSHDTSADGTRQPRYV